MNVFSEASILHKLNYVYGYWKSVGPLLKLIY